MIKTQPSLNDRIVALFYWPVLILSAAIFLAPIVDIFQPIDRAFLKTATITAGAILGFLFVMTLIDSKMIRLALDFADQSIKGRKSMSFAEKLFPPYGDRYLIIANRHVWVEFVILALARNIPFLILAFIGFGMTMVMYMRSLKADTSWRPKTQD